MLFGFALLRSADHVAWVSALVRLYPEEPQATQPICVVLISYAASSGVWTPSNDCLIHHCHVEKLASLAISEAQS